MGGGLFGPPAENFGMTSTTFYFLPSCTHTHTLSTTFYPVWGGASWLELQNADDTLFCVEASAREKHTDTRTNTHAKSCTHTLSCTRYNTQTHMCVRMHAYKHTHVYIHTYARIHTCSLHYLTCMWRCFVGGL